MIPDHENINYVPPPQLRFFKRDSENVSSKEATSK